MLIFQLAALTFTAAVLCLTLKKDQPAFAFLVSVCAAAGVLAAVLHQAQPVLDWLDTWGGYFQGAGLGCLVRVLGIALGASFTPILLHCLLYSLAFSGAGIAALASGQKQCGRLCRLYAEGAGLCGSVLVLYFFLVFLSTALLLLTGNGV